MRWKTALYLESYNALDALVMRSAAVPCGIRELT
jgi:hypothetical protein